MIRRGRSNLRTRVARGPVRPLGPQREPRVSVAALRRPAIVAACPTPRTITEIAEAVDRSPIRHEVQCLAFEGVLVRVTPDHVREHRYVDAATLAPAQTPPAEGGRL